MTGRLLGVIAVLVLLPIAGCSDEKPDRPALKMTPELAAAKEKAMVLCAGCHGPTGIGTMDFNPNLACQKKGYMVKQLNDYHEGKRTNHIPMTNIARMLNPQEIETISLWYSLQNCLTH